MLLNLGGPSLQNTYFLLPGAVEDPEPECKQPYRKCINLLDEFYAPKLNTQHEAFLLRSIVQEQEEKFDTFVQRIRAQVEKCDVSNETADLMTILQILSGVKAIETRRKILERERTVDEAIAIGRNNETLQDNLKSYSSDRGENSGVVVQRVVQTSTARRPEMRRSCFNCGKPGHFARDNECKARDAKCNKCGKVGHFAVVCLGNKRKWEERSEFPPTQQSRDGPKKRVRRIVENEAGKKQYFVFNLENRTKLSFKLGNCELQMRVDSGSDITVISGQTWDKLKDEGLYWDQRSLEEQSCFGYEKGQAPITILGTFMTRIEFKDRMVEEKVYIAPNGNDDIIGYKAATSLKVLYVGDMGKQTDKKTINVIKEIKKFPKIEGYVVKLEIDETKKPVQQQFRKIPEALEEKVETKVKELLQMDVIEALDEPPTWLSPVVPVIKDGGEVRICIDMRRANEAIRKGFYAFGSIEDLIFSIQRPMKLSKIDMSNAFHLFELDESSRNITAFAVKSGNYRYTRG